MKITVHHYLLNMDQKNLKHKNFSRVLSSLSRVCRRCNVTLISNLCEAVPRSLFWASNKLNKLLEVGFKIPFNLIGKSTTAVLTGLSWHILKSWYIGEDPE